MCVELKADWDKGYQRKAMALHGMRRYGEATEAYSQGLKLNQANDLLKSG